MPEITTKHLTELKETLEKYFDSSNAGGFINIFYKWVVDNWDSGKFYETEIIDSGYEVSQHPLSTDKMRNMQPILILLTATVEIR